MLDTVMLKLVAGDGGDGKVSFRREKYVPRGGPDGGDGGDGGSLIIRGSKHLGTLAKYSGKTEFVAQPGQKGGKRKQIGSKGEDLVLEVPLGTTVWLLGENKTSRRAHLQAQAHEGNRDFVPKNQRYDIEEEGQNPTPLDEDQIEPLDPDSGPPDSLKNVDIRQLPKIELVQILTHGQEEIVCRGGRGGRGSNSFKSSAQTTPMTAEYGTQGESKLVLLELKLLADVGLVGLPNAGKSTLLTRFSEARPKIADYPFTTLQPNLGVVKIGEGEEAREWVLADIPGLIEGATSGKGLGFQFLRHIESCRVLWFVLYLSEEDLFEKGLNQAEMAQSLVEQYHQLQTELRIYDPKLLDKPTVVSINKLDLYEEELQAEIKQVFQKEGLDVTLFSASTHQNLDEIIDQVGRVVSEY